ncbi:Ig-like domain-containing protein [Psychrosphaera sp. 1_MG-2023]|uniref:Ig-like domain-containing protein n=1 Tax=Psychrosphaera sp. 1_MG-2023 TaxID=3062643 RepID=UPI0026E1A237|nr:Ig-like domain-containing protein [Psychrosphaera sp. 1_MG-2023]MDO6718338.1 Ig-like domain-containing protein [Psychrosphaera sp. 1_MG-2023]
MVPTLFKRLSKLFLIGLFSLVGAACSGGGDIIDDTDETTTDDYTLVATLITSSETANSNLTEGSTLIVRATLTNSGEVVSGKTINFSSSNSLLASLSSSSAVTDGDGIAEIEIVGLVTAGEGVLTVSANDSTLNVADVALNFSSEGRETVRNGEFNHDVYLVPATTVYADYANITSSSLNTISTTQAATLLIKYSDADGNAISNSLVELQLVDDAEKIATLSNDLGKDLTDDNGFAFFKINATELSGAGYLKVVFDDGVETLITFKSIGQGNSGEAANYSLIVSMVNTNNEVDSTLSSGENLIVNATLTNNGVALAGEVVTFTSTNNNFASLSGTSITTNDQGVATITLTGANVAGTGTITVDVPASNISVNKVNLGFTSLGVINSGSDEISYGVFLIPSSTTYELYAGVSVSSITTISSAQPGTILIKLAQADGTPISRSLVTISLVGDANRLATLSNDLGSDLTDSNGFASINLIATDVSGAGYIQVTFDDGKTSLIAFESLGDGNQEPVKEIGSIELLASSVQLASSGSDVIELLALVKDRQNNLMEDIQVSFSSDTGVIQVTEPSTAANGVATALLKTLNNPESRTISASAFVGDKSASVTIEVSGTTIKIVGNNSIVTGDTVDMTVVMLDSDGNGIAQRNIIISSQAGNTFTKSDGNVLNQIDNADGTVSQYVTTDSTGSATFRLTADNSGLDTLTAEALGESGQLALSVSPDSFVISDLKVFDGAAYVANNSTNEVPLSGGQLTLTWQKDDVPNVGNVLFSSTRGNIVAVDCADDTTASNTTNASGQICVNMTSTDAGPAIITAKADGLSASFNVEFVAEIAHLLQVQASPFSLGPNGQKSTVSAVVVDDLGNFVKNKIVNFTLYDVSNGSISRQSDITDSNGLATTVYTSNGISALDGVVVAACTDVAKDSGDCLNVLTEPNDITDQNRRNDIFHCEESDSCVHDEVKLTVADRELFIAVGAGNTLDSASDIEYQKSFSVIVTDVESNPVEGVELSVSAVPESYIEGFWAIAYNDEGEFDKYVPFAAGECPNEDIDRDGYLDQIEDIDGDGKFDLYKEDIDGDGRLDTFNEDVDGDRVLDIAEDLDGDLNIDVDEDIDGDNNHDLFYEYVAGVCSLDDARNIDLNNDGNLDTGEDVNCNGKLDDGEDRDNDGLLDLTEDLDTKRVTGDAGHQDYDIDINEATTATLADAIAHVNNGGNHGDGRFDRVNEDVDGDGKLDGILDLDGDGVPDGAEDKDGDGYLDTYPDYYDGIAGRDLDGNEKIEGIEVGLFEDIDGDGNLDVVEHDFNHDGISDTNGITEDRNQNGTLEPGNVVTVLGDLITDENGATTVNIRYAESYGAWVKINLVVKAKVGGTEYMQAVPLVLPYSSGDVTNEDSPPTPNLFGSDGVCSTVN